jgi:predicted nucleic acid-binding protein
MTRLLIDTSVLIKWFHREGEREIDQARAIRDAHVRGDLTAHVLDLAIYEVGNVLVRALRWRAPEVSAQIDDLLTLVGAPISPLPEWHRDAAALAEAHSLSFYDASWAAAANALHVPLVSADQRLLAAGLAESPSEIANRLHLAH